MLNHIKYVLMFYKTHPTPIMKILTWKHYSNIFLALALVAEWLRVRLRVRMVKGSTLTVGNFLSLENLNVIIRAIN